MLINQISSKVKWIEVKYEFPCLCIRIWADLISAVLLIFDEVLGTVANAKLLIYPHWSIFSPLIRKKWSIESVCEADWIT